VSVATVATQWERGKIIDRRLTGYPQVDTNSDFTDTNYFMTTPVPTVTLHYNEMMSIAGEIAAISKNAMPTIRNVSYNANAGIAGQADNIVDDMIKALTEPLTAEESFAGLWIFPDEPRYIAEGSYDHVKNIMEGDLTRCTTTRASAQYTDGSPVALPTDKDLALMLAATSHSADTVIGSIKPSGTPVTVKDVAVLGIMAGLKPPVMPILLALTECAVYTHDFGEQLGGADGWFDYVVNITGPVTLDNDVALNTGGPASAGPAPLTPGVPTNTGIGRFLRLLMVNVGGTEPGIMEAKGIGSPAKTGMVVAEAHLETGWPGFSTVISKDPLGYKTGVVNKNTFEADESTVTLFINWADIIYQVGYNAQNLIGPGARADGKVTPIVSPEGAVIVKGDADVAPATLWASPGGLVPQYKPADLNWLTEAQYNACRTQLGNVILAAKRTPFMQEGLMAYIRVSTARALNSAGITREMAARFVSEFCRDYNWYARNISGLGSTIISSTFTIQGESINAEWDNAYWMPSITEDPNAIVKYYPNPKGINLVVGPTLTWTPMVMPGTPRWTASIDEWGTSGTLQIHLDANGGTVSVPIIEIPDGGGTLPFIPTPSRLGHKFLGWFTALDGGEQVSTETMFSLSCIIFARWEYVGAYPVESLKIATASGDPAPSMMSVERSSNQQFGVSVNELARTQGIVWATSDASYAVVDTNGLVTIANKSGIVILTATDTETGITDSIVLRIT
jgi:hypothetical protein